MDARSKLARFVPHGETVASDLCRELGLGDQLSVQTMRSENLHSGQRRLVEIPDGSCSWFPQDHATLLSPLFSPATKFKMAQEWFHPPRKAEADETVASLVERHYGAEMVTDSPIRYFPASMAGKLHNSACAPCCPASPRWKPSTAAWDDDARPRRKTPQAAKGAARPLFTSLKAGCSRWSMRSSQGCQVPCSTLDARTGDSTTRRWMAGLRRLSL